MRGPEKWTPGGAATKGCRIAKFKGFISRVKSALGWPDRIPRTLPEAVILLSWLVTEQLFIFMDPVNKFASVASCSVASVCFAFRCKEACKVKGETRLTFFNRKLIGSMSRLCPCGDLSMKWKTP